MLHRAGYIHQWADYEDLHPTRGHEGDEGSSHGVCQHPTHGGANELKFDLSSATEAIAKIEKLSKLVMGANVSIKDIFSHRPKKTTFLKGGR